MDITLKNVSPDMAEAIRLLASKADAGCGPKIEVEVTPEPENYDVLELRMSRYLTGQSSMVIGFEGDPTYFAVVSFPPGRDNETTAREVVRRYNLGTRAFALARHIVNYFEHGCCAISSGGKAHSDAKSILADLDAGPKK